MVLPSALESVNPAIAQYFSFGRLRPVHTNAAIFAFAGNAIFAAVYYSTQRLCSAVCGARCFKPASLLGMAGHYCRSSDNSPARIYARQRVRGIGNGDRFGDRRGLVGCFLAGKLLMTLWTRRERHMYVALWFYIATIVTVTILHVFNNLVVPMVHGRVTPFMRVCRMR